MINKICSNEISSVSTIKKSDGKTQDLIKKDFVKNWTLYLLVLPVIAFYLIFCYVPMFGIIIAFKDYTIGHSFFEGSWVGFKYFHEFLTGTYFWRTFRNTLNISVSTLIFGFPAPIILALLFNEIKNRTFLKVVQNITYLPHFISIVVICGMIKEFTVDTGIVNDISAFFGIERVSMLLKPQYFVPVYVISDIWQGIGWSSIIYLAALAGIDTELYEAAIIDGANRWKQIIHITIPCIMPTVIIMLILKLGTMLNVGFEKIILLYNPATYSTSDVISTFVYRKGLLESDWSYSTAVGLFNSIINLSFLVISNMLSKKYSDTSLW